MSTATIPGQYPPHNDYRPATPRLTLVKPDTGSLNLLNAAPHSLAHRRRANFQQGRALEIIGHAIEYLVDSRMFLIDQPATPADAETIQTLMLLSRQVFAECAELVPPARRLRLWIEERLSVPANC